MSNTVMQIRRSIANSTVTGLAAGQLAFTANGTGVANQGLLYIGNPSGGSQQVIGGIYNFGVLTANQAIVTNATSYVDKLLTANLTATNAFITTLYANGALGVAGNVLSTNSSGGIYWGTVAAGGVTITMGNGLTSTQSPLTTSGTMSVNNDGSLKFTSGALGVNAAAGSGLVANATGVWVQVANGLNINATGFIGVNAFSNSTLGGLVSNATGLVVLGNNGISSNTTGVFANLAASPGLTFTSGGLAVSPAGSIAVGATTAVNTGTNGGLVANATGLWAKAGNGIAVDAGGINVLAGASGGLLSNSTGTWAVVNTSQLVVAAGGITHNATGVVTLQDLTCSGNLTVSGTLVSLNATDLLIKDNMLQLAANQSGQAGTFLTGDAADSGLYFQIGNSSSNACFSGFSRLKNALGSSNTQPYFKIWAGNTAPTSTTVTASNTGYLESFLVPYGAGGAFVANGTNISIVASASVAAAITANTLTVNGAAVFQTPVAVSNLASGTDGYVLQTATGTATAYYGTLDGGIF